VTVVSKIYRSASEKEDLLVTIQTVPFSVNATHVKEFESAANEIKRALLEVEVSGIRYTICKANDGVTFLAILQVSEGMENPLSTHAEGDVFLKSLETWVASPLERLHWEPISARCLA
jgi:hypothetical protein